MTDRPLRVLHVIPAVAPRYGGPSTAIVPMCLTLAARDLHPLLVTTDADGPGCLSVPLGKPIGWQGVPSLFFKRDWSESFKYSRGLAAWMHRHVREFDVAHLHAVLSHAPLAAAAACRAARVPYIVRPLGTLAPWSLTQKAWKKRALLAVSGIRMLRGAAAIHYTSRGEQLAVEQRLHLSRGVVIPLGVDPRYLTRSVVSAAERGRDPYVLALSRLHPKKNLEVLIEAFVDVCRDRQPWRLVIAGGGDPAYTRELQRLVQALRIDSRVSFTGWVDGEVKHDLMARASVFALPSLDENFGVSLVEGLAAGVPALVSRQVHLADVVDEGRAGWVVDTDRESVRCGLRDAIENDGARDARALAARQLARQFAWPDIAAQLANLYARIARTVRRAPNTAAGPQSSDALSADALGTRPVDESAAVVSSGVVNR